MERVKVIQKAINAINAKTYLEIGVMSGRCFYRIRCPHKIAVDPEFRISFTNKVRGLLDFSNKVFLEVTSDALFSTHTSHFSKGVDVAFVDGLHIHEQSYRDVRNCLLHLNEGGYIVIHDCLPPNAAAAHPNLEEARQLSGYTEQWCGTVYKTALSLQNNHDDIRVTVLDCDYGLGVIKVGDPHQVQRVLSAEEIEALTFEEFQEQKHELLNIQSYEYINTVVSE